MEMEMYRHVTYPKRGRSRPGAWGGGIFLNKPHIRQLNVPQAVTFSYSLGNNINIAGVHAQLGLDLQIKRR